MTELFPEVNRGASQEVAPDNAVYLDQSEAILVTGTTGFLGAYLLSSLMEKYPDVAIYCLVRGKNKAHGLERIRQTLLGYGLPVSRLASSVTVVLGDLGNDRFGLTAEAYGTLANRIDTVFHSGAAINWLGSYESLQEINVQGTRRIIELAQTGKAKNLHYISTTAIYYSLDIVKHGYLNKGVGIEEYSRHLIGYFKTKWVAEQLVHDAFRDGLPGTITRPSFISGTLKSGYLPENDLTRLFINACFDCGGIPDIDLFVDIIPVDIVAGAILNVATLKDPQMRIYNLSNPSGVSLKSLGTVAEALGLPVSLCSHDEWQKKLRAGHATPAMRILQKLTRSMPGAEEGFLNFLSQAGVDQADIDTVAALEGTGITCPTINEQSLMNYLGAIIFNPKIAAE